VQKALQKLTTWIGIEKFSFLVPIGKEAAYFAPKNKFLVITFE
jgi:hypothetical protein